MPWRALNGVTEVVVRTLGTLALSLIVALPAVAQERVLDLSRSLEGITTVTIDAGVGEIEVIGDAADETLTARVELSPRSGFWGSRSRREVERAELVGTVRGDTLALRVTPRDEKRGFGEDWVIHLPARIAVDINLGVGDVSVLDTAANIDVDLGVGDVRIEGEHRSFGSIRASAGVGNVTLRSPEGRQSGDGFVGHTLRSRGPGEASISVSVGVGDTDIRLR